MCSVAVLVLVNTPKSVCDPNHRTYFYLDRFLGLGCTPCTPHPWAPTAIGRCFWLKLAGRRDGHETCWMAQTSKLFPSILLAQGAFVSGANQASKKELGCGADHCMLVQLFFGTYRP